MIHHLYVLVCQKGSWYSVPHQTTSLTISSLPRTRLCPSSNHTIVVYNHLITLTTITSMTSYTNLHMSMIYSVICIIIIITTTNNSTQNNHRKRRINPWCWYSVRILSWSKPNVVSVQAKPSSKYLNTRSSTRNPCVNNIIQLEPI